MVRVIDFKPRGCKIVVNFKHGHSEENIDNIVAWLISIV